MRNDNDLNTNKHKKIKKWLIKIIILFLVVILVLFLGTFMYLKLGAYEFYHHSNKEFVIPDIGNSFVPQGLSYDKRSNYFFITGYMSNNKASPIYLVEKSSNKYIKRLQMQDPDGKEFYNHSGGITVHGDYIYIAGYTDSCLFVFRYEDAINASDNGTIKSIGKFPMPDYMNVAFTSSDDNIIYVGEFFRKQNYPTDKSHKMYTSSGDYNQALFYSFRFSNNNETALFGIEPRLFEVYSIPDFVQGVDTYNGKIYLSTSYGLPFSHIYVYDKPQSKNFTLAGMTIPLYELDSSSLIKTYKYPSMCEEIVCMDDKIYSLYESASNKYIFGKLLSSNYCYSTDINWD
ncbi:hypothetical protein BCR32DRAFT_271592 [Anaeromyces robustus]|uniref:Calcium-dependent phosphotriesterase n=1 Tax=Anaeromyces robustus TaxID=1754192 RepID=A0A1Y1WQY3_9FUNG|nr:hypothetical protein BCR32DRAFT_271592 [Anaeromyces robustus]|eukprot:ORX75940.1 hypothetical protein BCR32DRAFT_271592 [Anaeromyces robustus]